MTAHHTVAVSSLVHTYNTTVLEQITYKKAVHAVCCKRVAEGTSLSISPGVSVEKCYQT